MLRNGYSARWVCLKQTANFSTKYHRKGEKNIHKIQKKNWQLSRIRCWRIKYESCRKKDTRHICSSSTTPKAGFRRTDAENVLGNAASCIRLSVLPKNLDTISCRKIPFRRIRRPTPSTAVPALKRHRQCYHHLWLFSHQLPPQQRSPFTITTLLLTRITKHIHTNASFSIRIYTCSRLLSHTHPQTLHAVSCESLHILSVSPLSPRSLYRCLLDAGPFFSTC